VTVVLLGTTKRFIGGSGDTKPTGVPAGSTFYAQDTGVTYVTYDDGTHWVVDSSGGSGGGGGAATIADGADVTEGAIADAAVAAGAAGTQSAKLRRLTTDLATRLSESDFDTKAGSLTETAPATDTASSGLNGRLQRLAQRLTSLISQLPAALGQTTAAGSLSVVSASDQVGPGVDVTATGALGALNAALTISAKGLSAVATDIQTGTLSGTVTYEATLDDTNWIAIAGAQVVTNGAWNSADTSFPARRVFPVGGFSQFRIRVSSYTSGTSNGFVRGSVSPHVVRPGQGLASETTATDGFSNSLAYLFNNNTASRLLAQAMYTFNGSSAATWDRLRNNFSIAAIASGSRSTTQTGSDITTYNARYLKVVLDMTVVTSSPSVTLTIQGKSVAGVYYTLLAGAAVVTVSTNVYEIGPGLPATANVSANVVLPSTIRLLVTANNANAGTYSLDYDLSV
jgi:hypothetical protein